MMLKKFFRKQSILTFNGIHKSYTKYDNYTSKQKEFLMDKPLYLVFAVKNLSILLIYETYYDKFQPYFGEKNTNILHGYW